MREDIKITLLSYDDYGSCNILKRYGYKDYMTEFCAASGASAQLFSSKKDVRAVNIQSHKTFSKSPDARVFNIITVDQYDGSYRDYDTHADYCTIRPVLELSDELFEEVIKHKKRPIINWGKKRVDIVYLGEYIIYGANKHKEELDKLLEEDKLEKTGETYTIRPSGWSGELKTYDVYRHNGNKYIKVQTRLNTHPVQSKVKIDGQIYTHGKEDWYRIFDVSWIIDYDNKRLISERSLLSGIQFTNVDMYDGIFEKTIIYKFMKEHMLVDLFQNEPLFQKATNRDIKPLLTEIVKYKSYYLGDDDIQAKVNALVEGYNREVKNLSRNHDKKLSFNLGYKNVDTLYNELLGELKEIIKRLKSDYEKAKPYNYMIDSLTGAVNDTKISKFIVSINGVINHSLFDKEHDELTSEFNSIVAKHISKCKAGIEEIKNGNPSKTKEEIEFEFRKDIHPFLEKLNLIAEKKDVVNEIMNGVRSIIKDEYTECKNERVKYLLDVINEVRKYVKEKGTAKENASLTRLLDFEIDYSKDMKSIFDKLNEIVKKAYTIELGISERTRTKTYYSSSLVDVDINYFFEKGEQELRLRG